jgi:hypothetical protein
MQHLLLNLICGSVVAYAERRTQSVVIRVPAIAIAVIVNRSKSVDVWKYTWLSIVKDFVF